MRLLFFIVLLIFSIPAIPQDNDRIKLKKGDYALLVKKGHKLEQEDIKECGEEITKIIQIRSESTEKVAASISITENNGKSHSFETNGMFKAEKLIVGDWYYFEVETLCCNESYWMKITGVESIMKILVSDCDKL